MSPAVAWQLIGKIVRAEMAETGLGVIAANWH
jgi:hypothetical protein